MPQASSFALHDQLLNGELEQLLREWRSESPPRTFDAIAAELQRRGHSVSRSTVNRWCRDLNITTPTEEVAS